MNLKIISALEIQDFYQNFTGEKSFLQSAKFGFWREKMGETIIRLGIFEKGKLVGTAQIQKVQTKFKTFLHLPHGPLLQNESAELWNFFLEEYKKLGKTENADFVRISPLVEDKENKIFIQKKFRPAPIHLVNPEKTWVLNLQDSEEEILAHMKKSTRYEVRRGDKCSLQTTMGNGEKELQAFWELHSQTVQRQKFVPFSFESTSKELEVWGEDVQIFLTKYEEENLSAAVIIFDNNAAYYHQGASVYSKLPAAHATLWSAIIEAKKRGCQEFNFWGVCGEDETKHPWYGLSKFKRGFGGKERNFLHVQDFPITTKYWLNVAVEKYRKWQRGY